METVVIVIHLIVVSALVVVVLLQKSEGGALVGSSNQNFLSSRGTGNVLTRATAILATVFFITSLTLGVLAGMDRRPTSILQGGGTTAPVVPGQAPAPLGGGGGGILDTLQGGPPAPPAAPAVPEAPRSQ
jgi:preprotein translocase subunit SecG